jgi:hypothetical protein
VWVEVEVAFCILALEMSKAIADGKVLQRDYGAGYPDGMIGESEGRVCSGESNRRPRCSVKCE